MPWPRGVPKNMTPAQRVERARKAALARTTIDHHITALSGKVLSPEQRQRLTELLRTEGADA